MKVPQFKNFIPWLSAFGLVCAGAVIGAALFMVVYQHNMTELMQQNMLLRDQRDQLIEEIEPLKTYRDSESVLKTIEVHFESLPVRNPPDPVVLTEIKKNIHEQMRPLIGTKIATFYEHPRQIKSFYGSRILPNIHGKDYIIEIDTVFILYGKLNIWIAVEERKD